MSGFKEGELIISSTPYAYVLNNICRGQFCDYCFRENNELKKCSQCGFLYYCDKSCQKKAWEMHKTECKFLKGSSIEPPEIIRLCILVLMKIRKHGFEEPHEIVGNQKVTIASLMSHAEDFKSERLEKVLHIKSVIDYFMGLDNEPSYDAFVEIYGKIETNAFSIHSLSSNGRGVGLYLGPSIFDHSCDDDAAWSFVGTTLYIRMMRSVPHRDLSRLRVSYFNTITLREERMKFLWETKFFVCSCSICTSPKYDKLLTKLVSDTPEIKEKAIKCKKEVEELLSEDSSIDKEAQLLYAECKRLLESQSGVLADTNIYRIRTLKNALNACLSLNKVSDAVKFASQLEKPYRMFYRTNDPSLGQFYYQYGKCLFLLGHYQEAFSKFSEAEAKLKVTLGENHPMIITLRNFIRRCLY